MAVDLKMVVAVREATGAGMVDVKNALEEAGGNKDLAVDILRKKGILKAAGKATRETKEGLVHSYIHGNGKVGALVAVSCETDFVARNESFQSLVHDIAMQVVATDPIYLSPEEIPAEVLEREKSIHREVLKSEGKPAEMIEKILEGKMQKYYGEVCLLKQFCIKDDKTTVETMIKQAIATIGENIQIKKFARFAL